MVDPKLLCRKHLLGEHVETHMFVGTMRKGYRLDGYLKKGLVEPMKIKERHDELVKEMKRRGYKHKSEIEKNPETNINNKVNIRENLLELIKRCSICKSNIGEII